MSITRLALRRALAPAFALILPLIAQPAAAAVVTIDYGWTQVANGSSKSLDVDGDGTLDLRITDYYDNRVFAYDSAVRAYGFYGSMITAGAALADGDLIDSADSWTTSSQLSFKYYNSARTPSSTYSGAWIQSNATMTGILGFSLALEDGTHYGWLQLMVDGDGWVRIGTLAWETVAGVAITAGSTESLAPELPAVPLPASAALLLGGIGALGGLRRRKRG